MKTFCNNQMLMADLAKVRLNYMTFLADEVHMQEEREKIMAEHKLRFHSHTQRVACLFARRLSQDIEKNL